MEIFVALFCIYIGFMAAIDWRKVEKEWDLKPPLLFRFFFSVSLIFCIQNTLFELFENL